MVCMWRILILPEGNAAQGKTTEPTDSKVNSKVRVDVPVRHCTCVQGVSDEKGGVYSTMHGPPIRKLRHV